MHFGATSTIPDVDGQIRMNSRSTLADEEGQSFYRLIARVHSDLSECLRLMRIPLITAHLATDPAEKRYIEGAVDSAKTALASVGQNLRPNQNSDYVGTTSVLDRPRPPKLSGRVISQGKQLELAACHGSLLLAIQKLNIIQAVSRSPGGLNRIFPEGDVDTQGADVTGILALRKRRDRRGPRTRGLGSESEGDLDEKRKLKSAFKFVELPALPELPANEVTEGSASPPSSSSPQQSRSSPREIKSSVDLPETLVVGRFPSGLGRRSNKPRSMSNPSALGRGACSEHCQNTATGCFACDPHTQVSLLNTDVFTSPQDVSREIPATLTRGPIPTEAPSSRIASSSPLSPWQADEAGKHPDYRRVSMSSLDSTMAKSNYLVSALQSTMAAKFSRNRVSMPPLQQTVSAPAVPLSHTLRQHSPARVYQDTTAVHESRPRPSSEGPKPISERLTNINDELKHRFYASTAARESTSTFTESPRHIPVLTSSSTYSLASNTGTLTSPSMYSLLPEVTPLEHRGHGALSEVASNRELWQQGSRMSLMHDVSESIVAGDGENLEMKASSQRRRERRAARMRLIRGDDV